MNNPIVEKQIDALVGALTDPIIVFTSPWMDTLPEWIKGEIATDAEALAYVSNAILCQPIASEWVDIYQYLMTRVTGEKVPEDMRKESVGDYQMELLSQLKEWIYRQRVKARKERRSAERAKARAEAEAKAPKQPQLGV